MKKSHLAERAWLDDLLWKAQQPPKNQLAVQHEGVAAGCSGDPLIAGGPAGEARKVRERRLCRGDAYQ